jgi:hypothetical protein
MRVVLLLSKIRVRKGCRQPKGGGEGTGEENDRAVSNGCLDEVLKLRFHFGQLFRRHIPAPHALQLLLLLLPARPSSKPEQ